MTTNDCSQFGAAKGCEAVDVHDGRQEGEEEQNHLRVAEIDREAGALVREVSAMVKQSVSKGR
jgi:hypothetical protein